MKLTVLSLVAIGFAAGCNKKETEEQSSPAPQVTKALSTVVVPAQVQGKWKAVQIEVADKNAHLKKVYSVKIGSDFKLPGSDLTLKVETFLPHFVMEGTTLTSQSNDLVNPAAQLVIRENGKEIYKGWLFSLYPATHAFQHPQYGFTLVDYQPAS